MALHCEKVRSDCYGLALAGLADEALTVCLVTATIAWPASCACPQEFS